MENKVNILIKSPRCGIYFYGGVMKKKTNIRWIVEIVVFSLTMSVVFSFMSSEILDGAGYIVAFVLLLAFVALGVIFDVIGVAVTSATETPFHAMASHKERGAREALRLLRKSDKVSSICNDVVGDISGIISGATAAAIAGNLTRDFGLNGVVMSLVVTGAVSALTIGGKAVGKTIALSNNTQIIFTVGKLMSFLPKFGKKK